MKIILPYIAFFALIILVSNVIRSHIRDNHSPPYAPDKKTNIVFSSFSYWICFFSFLFLLVSFLLEQLNKSLGMEFKLFSFILWALSVIIFFGIKKLLDSIIRVYSNRSY